jgi:DNA-directed RNA polymerase subunit RPC12/RpoP
MAEGGTAPGVAFIKCARCGEPVSAIAALCPKCGYRLAAPFVRKARRKVHPGFVIALLVVCVGAGAYLVATPQGKETLSRFASAVGVPIVPWTARAQIQANDLYAQRGNALAAGMLAAIHPTGQNATLASHATTLESGGILVSHFELAWWTGAPRTKNTTLIEWRCSERGDMAAAVGGDSAPSAVTARGQAQLDDYFRTNIFPSLKKNAN